MSKHGDPGHPEGNFSSCPTDGSPPRWRSLAGVLLFLLLLLPVPHRLPDVWPSAAPAWAITAPELRSQRSLQDLQPDMHGRDLRQQEFLKAALAGYDFHGADLRGAVFNTADLRDADLHDADLEDVVAFASRFDGADLRGTNLRNAMLMQSRFREAEIEGADFSDAVLDLPERRALCTRATGVHPISGISTRDSLECR